MLRLLSLDGYDMYKVKLSIIWENEAKARMWCRENSILFRMSDSDFSYEETKEIDKELHKCFGDFIKNDTPIYRAFCFKHEEDAVAFKLKWA